MGEVRARLSCAALTLTLLLNLFPVTARADSTENCPNGTACTHEAAIGTTHYDTLEEAAAAAVSGQTIILHTNVELEAQVDLPDGVTLDGRGRKISAASDTWSSNSQSKYMLVGGDQVTIQDVTLDGAGVAAGCLQFYKAKGGSLQGLVTLKNAQGLGLAINASQVTAEGVLTLKGNGWGDIINVGWGSQLSGMDRCSFDGSAAALEGVAAVYTDHSDVRNAGGDVASSPSGCPPPLPALPRRSWQPWARPSSTPRRRQRWGAPGISPWLGPSRPPGTAIPLPCAPAPPGTGPWNCLTAGS